MKVKRFLPLIGIVILFILLIQFDYSELFAAVREIPLLYLLISLGASIPVVLISNVEWQYLLKKQQINVSFIASMKNIFIGYFFGFITPGGLGAYTRVLYLSDDSSQPVERCLYNIGLLNTIDLITLFFISICGAFLFSRLYPVLFISLLVLCIIWIGFLIVFIHRRTWNVLLDLIFRFTLFRPYHQWISDSITQLKHHLPLKKDIIITAVLSLIGWVLRFVLFYMVIRLFTIDVALLPVILIIAIANIISMILT